MKGHRVRRFVVMGFRGVGKSAMTIQFVEDHFVESYYPTIEAAFHKDINYGDSVVHLEIIDTAGLDDQEILQHQHCIGVHGYILVYSVSSRVSFDMIKVIHDRLIDRLGDDTVPRVLVGNKADLASMGNRMVAEEEGAALADEWGIPFIESSAKLNSNVHKVFESLLNITEASYKDPPSNLWSCLCFGNLCSNNDNVDSASTVSNAMVERVANTHSERNGRITILESIMLSPAIPLVTIFSIFAVLAVAISSIVLAVSSLQPTSSGVTDVDLLQYYLIVFGAVTIIAVAAASIGVCRSRKGILEGSVIAVVMVSVVHAVVLGVAFSTSSLGNVDVVFSGGGTGASAVSFAVVTCLVLSLSGVIWYLRVITMARSANIKGDGAMVNGILSQSLLPNAGNDKGGGLFDERHDYYDNRDFRGSFALDV